MKYSVIKTNLSFFHIQKTIMIKFFTVVRQGFQAQCTSLGKNPVALKPGLHFILPFYHNIKLVDMRERVVEINSLAAYTKDNVPVTLDGSLFFQVYDSHKACFSVQDFVSSVGDIGTSTVRSIVGTRLYDDIISDRRLLNEKLKISIGDSTINWGIECTKFEIQTFAPQNRNVEQQLERQMEEERNRRAQILQTQANVNIADGERQAEILKSQGLLESQKNAAEALYIMEQKKADALKYTKEMEAVAWQSQIEVIANSVGCKKTAVDFMLQQLKLQNLKSIADGPNNNTYFVPNNSTNFIENSITGREILKININEQKKTQ